MHHHCIFVLLGAVLFGSFANPFSPRWDDTGTKHSRNTVPKNWESLGRPPSGTTSHCTQAPSYGVHLSKEKVAKLAVAPHPETFELVKVLLTPGSSSNTTAYPPRVSVTQANALLDASYQFVETSETIVRTVGYALPAALHEHTPHNRSDGAAAGQWESASGKPTTMLSSRIDVKYLTPSFLRWLYITSYAPAATDRNYDPSQPQPEPDMDIQFSEAMAYPAPHIFYSAGCGRSGRDIDWFVSWLGYMLNDESTLQTISTSYAINEDGLLKANATCVCNLFGQLGLRGASVLFPSGNHSVGQGNRVTRDGSVQFGLTFPRNLTLTISPRFGMSLSHRRRRNESPTGYQLEVPASFFGSGFLEYFERPKYQNQAASTFLQDLDSGYQGLYKASGRGIPNIAAQAVGFHIIVNEVVAGIISLLNDWLIWRGEPRSPLGLLVPWLYGSGYIALNDITVGSNPSCNNDRFSATAGWDPVEGLGMPNPRPNLDAMQAVFQVWPI
ncbi:subtilisin-like protein [Lactarius deliciosus]|nr:subtilisin-like protein [Lactarius deliciosus]